MARPPLPISLLEACIFNCTDDWRSWRVEYPDADDVVEEFGHFFNGIWPAFIVMANDDDDEGIVNDSFVFVGNIDMVVDGGGNGDVDDCIEVINKNSFNVKRK